MDVDRKRCVDCPAWITAQTVNTSRPDAAANADNLGNCSLAVSHPGGHNRLHTQAFEVCPNKDDAGESLWKVAVKVYSR